MSEAPLSENLTDEAIEEVPKFATIARFRANSENKVSDDYFLYSCFEFEKTYAGNEHFPRYTGRPSAGGNFIEFIKQMLQFYGGTYEAIPKSDLVMNHQTLEDLLPAVTLMLRDFDEIYQAAHGKPVPKYDAKNAEAMAFWQEVRNTLESIYPHFGAYVFLYFRWSYGQFEEEVFEIGSRPPVGKYAPSYRMRNGGAAPPPRGGDRDRGGGRGPRRDGPPPRGNDRGGRGGNDRGRSGGGEHRSSGSRPEGRPERSRHEGPRDRGPRDNYEGRGNASDQAERTQKMEAEALKEVAAAIRALKESPEMAEFPLRAANSFYRRIQHQTVVQNGYHSYSAGEGNDRKVVVTREAHASQGKNE